MTAVDEDWKLQGLCRDEPDLHYPVGSEGPALRQLAAAKAMCARCPVQTECQQDALARGEPHGVWGGLSEQDRDRLLRRPAVRTATAA